MASEAELGTRLDKAMLYLEMDEARLLKKAQVIILELADDENYAPAQKILGDLYGKGELFKKDENKARYWHDRASGQITLTSKAGGKQDKQQSQYWLDQASKKAANIQANQVAVGKAGELLRIAEGILANPKNYQNQDGTPCTQADAVSILEPLAQAGCAPAQYCLGICYRDGKGVERNGKQAREWLQAAADQGNTKAKDILKYTYAWG